MDFSIAQIDDYGLFPPELALALTLAFLVASAVAASRRSTVWLFLCWTLGGAMGLGVALFFRIPFEWNPLEQLLEVSTRVLIPMTITTAVLLLLRDESLPSFGTALCCAVLVFMAACALSTAMAERIVPGLYISGFL